MGHTKGKPCISSWKDRNLRILRAERAPMIGRIEVKVRGTEETEED